MEDSVAEVADTTADVVVADDVTADMEVDYSTIDEKQQTEQATSAHVAVVTPEVAAAAAGAFTLAVMAVVLSRRRFSQGGTNDEAAVALSSEVPLKPTVM